MPTRLTLTDLAVRRSLADREEASADEVRRLLDAGLEVMRRCGTTTTPKVAEIVREAGSSNQAFYRYFATKHDLVAAIVEAGRQRLAGYLQHQMEKGKGPEAKVRRWVDGVLAQAGDREVAHATRSVLWNADQLGDRLRGKLTPDHEILAAQLREPLSQLGSPDPDRDAALMCHAVMGRMQELLWRHSQPTNADAVQIMRFCLSAVRRPA